MGRWYYNKKATAEASYKLAISRLRKDGMLSGQTTGKISWTSSMTGKETTVLVGVNVVNDPHIRLMYALTGTDGNKIDYDYEVSLLTTPCNFGGLRYWFGCPDCGRRVGVLYLTRRDAYFRCRVCDELSYRSRNRCRIERLWDIAEERQKLQSQIKRWTWQGRPTRKVRRLLALQRKEGVLSGQAIAYLDRLKAR